jgi:hypothetical protein
LQNLKYNIFKEKSLLSLIWDFRILAGSRYHLVTVPQTNHWLSTYYCLILGFASQHLLCLKFRRQRGDPISLGSAPCGFSVLHLPWHTKLCLASTWTCPAWNCNALVFHLLALVCRSTYKPGFNCLTLPRAFDHSIDHYRSLQD